MAGIGFQLRRFLNQDSFIGIIKVYSVAGLISSGPWIISILGILAIGFMTSASGGASILAGEFQVSVTYLMACSLILTGPFQFTLARYVSDRHYEKKYSLVLPNVFGAIAFVSLISGCLATVILAYFFEESLLYRVLMLIGFVTLCNIWLVVVLLSAVKAWKTIVFSFFLAYAITVVLAWFLRGYGTEGLLAGFVTGHSVLLFQLLVVIVKSYPSEKLLSFDYLRRGKFIVILALTGFFYNAAIWADKFIFWFNPLTSESILTPLRFSPIYDLPIFLAYLSIFPGMAVFLIRVETDFAEHYLAFYRSIREGGSLEEILHIRTAMVEAVRHGISDIFKVQGITTVILIAGGGYVLQLFNMNPLYRILLNIDLIAVAVQVLLMAILNVLFYFDQQRIALWLTVLFAFSNIGLTLISQQLGPAFYGYGFAASVILTASIGFIVLSKKLDSLLYETFMLRKLKI